MPKKSLGYAFGKVRQPHQTSRLLTGGLWFRWRCTTPTTGNTVRDHGVAYGSIVFTAVFLLWGWWGM